MSLGHQTVILAARSYDRRNLNMFGEAKDYDYWAGRNKRLLLYDEKVTAFVFHSSHIKIWADHWPRLWDCKTIRVKDQTDHFDDYLLPEAIKIFRRADSRGYTPHRALEVMLHYAGNQLGWDSREEIFWLLKRAWRLFWFQFKVTEKGDHGWEIKALEKAGLI